MINYSEDKDRQYHVQLEEGDVGRYVMLTGDAALSEDCRGVLKMLCL